MALIMLFSLIKYSRMNVFVNAVTHLLQIQIEVHVIALNTFTVYPFKFFRLKKPFLSDPFKQICKMYYCFMFIFVS